MLKAAKTWLEDLGGGRWKEYYIHRIKQGQKVQGLRLAFYLNCDLMLQGCLSRRGGDSSFSKDPAWLLVAEAGWFLICSNRPAIPLWVLTLVSHPHCCLALPQLTLLSTVPLCFAFLILLSYVMAFDTHFQLLPCAFSLLFRFPKVHHQGQVCSRTWGNIS